MNCPENRLRDSELGFYNPLTFIVGLNPPDATARHDGDEKVRVTLTTTGQATLWHEYTHFLQAVSTFQGIGELLNWFDVQLDFAKDGKLAVSGGIKQFMANPGVFPHLADSLSQRKDIIGLLYYRSERDLQFSAPREVPDFGLFMNGHVCGVPSMWLKLPFRDEVKAIRITRDFFAEGMARAVGDSVTGADMPPIEAAFSENQIIYYGLRAYLEKHLPGTDSRRATIVVGDACLFSDSPQVLLRHLHVLLTQGKGAQVRTCIDKGDSIGLARLCNPFFDSEWADYQAFLDDRIRGLQRATENEPGFHIRTLWEFVRVTIGARINGLTLQDILLGEKTWENFERVCVRLGGPLVNVEKEFIDPSRRKSLQDAWLHFLAGTQIIEKAFFRRPGACVLYDSPSCKHPAKGSCCENDILNVPVDFEKKACVVTQVVAIMGLR